jgi:hypothetical protein
MITLFESQQHLNKNSNKDLSLNFELNSNGTLKIRLIQGLR